ncbi:hypothetical protein [Streptomyces sp. NPDC059258]|uniref:hypothetical protein n=1 Tax=unclassified Streptomyces TaxID=2593676 RepID=UPI0036C0D0B3
MPAGEGDVLGARVGPDRWNSGIVRLTFSGVRRVKCCQMKMRKESIGSRHSTVWQPSPPTKMIASRVEGSPHR